jgi:hypothetical protein
LLGVVGIVGLGVAGGLVLTTRREAGATRLAADAEPEAAVVRALAERLLGRDVRLVPGETPEGLSLDVPVPLGGRLLGSVVRPGVPRAPATSAGEQVEVVLEAPGEAPALLAFYEEALARQGFAVAPVFGRQRPGGFLPSPGWTASPLYCRSEEGPGVSVSVYHEEGRPRDVRVRIEAAPFPPCTGSGPGVLTPSGETMELPLLSPPPDTQLQPGSSGPGVRGMEAIADTALSGAALEAHYAAQLEAAGWILRQRGGDGPLAWSAWLAPGAGERHGLLSVVEWPPGQDRRHIQLLLALPGLPAPGLP